VAAEVTQSPVESVATPSPQKSEETPAPGSSGAASRDDTFSTLYSSAYTHSNNVAVMIIGSTMVWALSGFM